MRAWWLALLLALPAAAAPIHDAVRSGSAAQVTALLEQTPALVGLPDEKGFTPLHVAAHEGNVEIATLLLADGANVNAVTPQNWTPLHEAVAQDKGDMVKLLLSKGANPNVREKQNSGTALHIACFHGNLEICKLLISGKANVNLRDREGLTPMWHARDQGYTQVVELLKSVGGTR